MYPASARVWPRAGASLNVYPRYYEKYVREIGGRANRLALPQVKSFKLMIGYSGGGAYGDNVSGDGGSNGSKGEDGTGFDYGVGGAGSGVLIDNIPITTFALRYAFSKPILTKFLLQATLAEASETQLRHLDCFSGH